MNNLITSSSLSDSIKYTISKIIVLYGMTPAVLHANTLLELALKLNIQSHHTDMIDLHCACMVKLTLAHPNMYYYVHIIVLHSIRDCIRDVIELLDLPSDTTVADLILHVATHASSHQLLCTYKMPGLIVGFYDPSVHRIIIDRSDTGYFIQGIDFDNKFGSIYVPDCTFAESRVSGGWHVPFESYDDCMKWIDEYSHQL